MDKKIEIPGYENRLHNLLFTKGGEDIKHPLLPLKIPVSDLLFMATYSAPTQRQVSKYIQNSIKGLELITAPREEVEREWYKLLSDSFKYLPDGEAAKIANGDKDVISHLERHCEFGEDIPGQRYLCAIKKQLPSQALDGFMEAYSSKGPFLLNNFNDVLHDESSFYLKLKKDGSLIDEKELNYLLDMGVRDSDILRVQCDRENYSNTVRNIKLIYSILNSSDNMNFLKDESKSLLLNSAVRAWANYSACQSNRSHMDGMYKDLMKVLGIAEDETDEEDKKKSGPDFFNKNSDN